MEQKANFQALARLAAPAFWEARRGPLMAAAAGLLGIGFGFGLAGSLTDTVAAVLSSPFDLFAKLLVVVGLILVAARILRAMGGRAGAGAGRHLNVIETAHLAQNRTLYLVGVADRVLVLGSTQSELNTLTVIDDASTVAALRRRPGSVFVERPFAQGEAVKQ